jgi:hypothetical protein
LPKLKKLKYTSATENVFREVMKWTSGVISGNATLFLNLVTRLYFHHMAGTRIAISDLIEHKTSLP